MIILHIIREDKQLGDVDEFAELFIPEAGVDAISFRKNTFLIVGLLHFDESQRHSVDQQCNIRTEFILAVFVSQFCNNMERIVAEVFIVNQSYARSSIKHIGKSLAQVFIVKRKRNVLEGLLNIGWFNTRIDPKNTFFENVSEDVRVFVTNNV